MSTQATLQEDVSVFRARGNVRATLTALRAIFLRDLLVAWQDLLSFLSQTLLQPLFLLFIFGKVLPQIGMATAAFTAVLLPGVVAFTVFLTAWQSMTVDLSVDLGFLHEIDDRLLAPLPVALVALEKVIFASLRALLAGVVIFPLAFVILGSGYQMPVDAFGITLGMMLLVALVAAALGMVLGTVTPAWKIQLTFSLIITPLIFTGCIYYPWFSLASLRWFQIATLLNPLTYASEGLRYAMAPTIHGQAIPTLPIGWILLVLCATLAGCLWLGVQLFQRRVIG